jgi:phospholipid/cholesterol/gamma-HCH transport system substrate-binding protein
MFGFTIKWRGVVIAVSAVVVTAVVATGGYTMYQKFTTTRVTAYFANANGIYAGDAVKIMGVDVGKIDSIEPDGDKMKIRFHYNNSYDVPADAKAAILSPSLVSARAIQLAPSYHGGPVLADGATIPIQRTAVPVEWDDFRKQVQRLAQQLGPTSANPAGPFGQFVNSAANALNGKGDKIHDTLDQLSKAMTTLSDGRTGLFATIRNLQVFISALAASDQQITQLNTHLASVTGALTSSDNDLGNALASIDTVAANLQTFVNNNRGELSTSVSQLADVTTALQQSKPDIEQLLHVGPNAFVNFNNIYQPAQGTLTGALAVTQFQNPIQFICGAIQAASQKGAAESAKLCAQYLGPVLKNLQMNYPPVGVNPVAGVQMRPDQVDYSENSLRPPPGKTDTSVPGVFAPDGADAASRPLVRPGTGLAGLMGRLLPGTATPPQGGGR